MADAGEKPKIITDEDWKQQARREKESLGVDSGEKTAAESAKAASQPGEPGLPPPTFTAHIESLAVQILFCLGAIADPNAKEVTVNLDLAKFYIDVLQMLEEKTQGNLTEEEKRVLSVRLHELRMHYVTVAQSR